MSTQHPTLLVVAVIRLRCGGAEWHDGLQVEAVVLVIVTLLRHLTQGRHLLASEVVPLVAVR